MGHQSAGVQINLVIELAISFGEQLGTGRWVPEGHHGFKDVRRRETGEAQKIANWEENRHNQKNCKADVIG